MLRNGEFYVLQDENTDGDGGAGGGGAGDDDKGDKDEDKTKATEDDEDYLDGQKKEKGSEGKGEHSKLPNRYGSGKSCNMGKSHEAN